MTKHRKHQRAMKRLNAFKIKLLEEFGTQILVAFLILIVTTTISFAWSTNNRLTRLEAAFQSIADDVHYVKTHLEANE